MDSQARRQTYLHFAVSTIGGFFGGYAILNHCEIFANAQTANLIHLVCKIFSADFNGLIFLFASLFTYMAGNAFFVIAQKYIKTDIRAISLVFDAVTIVLIGLFPNIANDYIALLPILFVTPIQWNSFRTAAGYVSSTIFSSNNVRQATMSLVSYIMDKDAKQLEKTKFYWSTILSFHTGVALSCVTSLFLGTVSIWFCFIPLLLSTFVYLKNVEFSFSAIVGRTFEHTN